MLSNGLGAFTTVGSSQWVTGWTIYMTDLNGDKRTDIFVYNPNSGIWYQARNLTNGTFTYSTGNWPTNLTIVVRTPFM